MQQQPTLNFGLTKNFFLIYCILSMRLKTKNDQNQGSNAEKNFFCLVPKSTTQMSSLSAKNASKKCSRLGTFKQLLTLPYPSSPPPTSYFQPFQLANFIYLFFFSLFCIHQPFTCCCKVRLLLITYINELDLYYIPICRLGLFIFSNFYIYFFISLFD